MLAQPVVSVLAKDRVAVSWDKHPAEDVVGYNVYRGVVHVRTVAEGTPGTLKAEIGRPTVQVIPADPDERSRFSDTLARFGESVAGNPGCIAVRLESGYDLADVVRALDSEGLRAEHLELDAPSLDDVFLAKTGHRLEGQAEPEPQAVTA